MFDKNFLFFKDKNNYIYNTLIINETYLNRIFFFIELFSLFLFTSKFRGAFILILIILFILLSKKFIIQFECISLKSFDESLSEYFFQINVCKLKIIS